MDSAMYVVIHWHDLDGIIRDDCRVTSNPDKAQGYAQDLRDELGPDDDEHHVDVYLFDAVGWESEP